MYYTMMRGFTDVVRVGMRYEGEKEALAIATNKDCGNCDSACMMSERTNV